MSRLSGTNKLFILGLLLVGHTTTAQKQAALTPCEVGRNAAAIGFWTWPLAARVKVYVRMKDFRKEELPYLLSPLEAWNQVSESTQSGVKFEYAGSTAEELDCLKCLTIKRGPVFDKAKRHVTETKAYSPHLDQIITYATIIIDPSLTNLRALSNAVTHELGHNLGLLDCYGCRKNTTLMAGFTALNVPNDLDAPSTCDVYQVRRAYADVGMRARFASIPEKIDEGEEPVDDDTPVIVRKP